MHCNSKSQHLHMQAWHFNHKPHPNISSESSCSHSITRYNYGF
jgi:hypothetical protein